MDQREEPPGRLDQCIEYVERRFPDGAAPDRLSEATAVAEHLTALADRLVGHFVDEARRAGASWMQIGQILGVSKQAAQKRFVGNSAGTPPHRTWGPPEWISEQTATLVQRSAAEARRLGHGYIEAEHLILAGLHDPDSLAVQAIHALGVSPEAVRAALIAAIPPNRASGPGESDHIPFTPRAKEALDARRVAKRHGHLQVSPEHILLNVLGSRKRGPARKTLNQLGVTERQVSEWLAAHDR
jgi:hypothetical protein